MSEHHLDHELLPKGLAGKLGPKIGPLPLGAWVVVIGAGVYVGHRRKAAQAAAGDSATDTEGTDGAGASSSSSAESIPDTTVDSTGVPSEMEPDNINDGGSSVPVQPVTVTVVLPAAPTPTRSAPWIVPAVPRPAHTPVERTLAKPTPTKRPRATPKTGHAKTYTVRSGDTLSAIGARAGVDWHAVYATNKATIEAAAKAHGKTNSDGGHWIYPGTVLRLP